MHYQSQEVVDNLIAMSGVALPLSGTGVGAGLVVRNKKIRLAMTALFASVIAIFIFTLYLSVYSRWYLGTVWGYPENINEFVTLTRLKDISFLGFVFMIISWVIIAALKLNDFRQGRKIK
jgi:hypothetical protein